MAKSIEQKAVDALVSAMNSTKFRPAEFSRIMATEELAPDHMQFMSLIGGYMNYLATFSEYGYYPNGLERECRLAADAAPVFLKHFQDWADEFGYMV